MIVRAFIALAGALAAANGVATMLGGHLSNGMRLTYSSGGVETPWVIDSVHRDLTVAGKAGCVRIWLRLSPAQPQADVRTHCVTGTTMSTWDDKSGALLPARPVAAGGLTLERPGGISVRYDVAAASADTVSGIVLSVLPTTVSTIDSTGRTVRRLRERFSPAIATATWGVFEVADSTASNGWRTTREFKLVAISR